MKRKLYTLSCFSGVGGFDFGAKLAGFESVLRSDFWKVTGQVFELNKDEDGSKSIPWHLRSEGECWSGEKGDITRMVRGEHLEELKALVEKTIGKGNTLDVIIGGPPCHDISKLNPNRKVFTKKNMLALTYLQLIQELQPKVALMEQVPDLRSEDYRPLYNKLVQKIEQMGNYHMRFEVMNAKDYGSKQSRQRLIMMLVRKDLRRRPSLPKPISPDISEVGIQALFPGVLHYSSKDYGEKVISARGKMFPTLTAGGIFKFYRGDGIGRELTKAERLIVTDLVGLNLHGIGKVSVKKLTGNMVQVHFAEAIFNHIKEYILQ